MYASYWCAVGGVEIGSVWTAGAGEDAVGSFVWCVAVVEEAVYLDAVCGAGAY